MKVVFLFALTLVAAWADTPHAGNASYQKTAQPLLEHYCYDCHGDGSSKGEFSMDEFADLGKHLEDIDHWIAVWRNIRSQIMPPSEEDQLELAEKKELLSWIEREVFKVDPKNPDPGRVTIRRLNRQEYNYAVLDLLGVDYNTWENFPADDTGYGFDTIGDVLSISPLHMEKYLEAAATVADRALPDGVDSHIPERVIKGKRFDNPNKEKKSAQWLAFNQERVVEEWVKPPAKGEYDISLNYSVRGAKLATDQTAHLELWVDEKKIAEREVGWDQNATLKLNGKMILEKKPTKVEVKIFPRKPPGENQEEQSIYLQEFKIKGPLDESYVEYPKGYRMIMVDGPAPHDFEKREDYARRIMRSFVSRAFRRPLDKGTIDRLVKMAMEVDRSPGKSFEDGIKIAITAVLASPRFLFRAEIQSQPNDASKRVQLDEYALASRLAFFLWSSVPDDELLSLAYQKKLRENLGPQIDRMLADSRGDRLAKNFVGQWLQARDVEHFNISPWKVLKIRDRRKAMRFFNPRLRADMRYGVQGVKGDEHRLVDLTENPERGGVLTQGTFLVVTSDPTRTSPVKRGLFVLDQILGTPAPPAPPNIPELEEAAHGKEEPMTMREMMKVHREKPACAGCHARMDPIGLGLENFNALGQFRRKESGQKIDSAGVLVTGEKFSDVVELKEILATDRKGDFYRCLAEKLLTYAIGRGVEYYDSATIDQLVDGMEKNGGTLKALVIGVIESAPFQMRRGDG